MKYSEKISYQQDTKALLAVFTNPEFFKAKYQAVGAQEIKVLAHQHEGEQFSIKISRKVPADIPIPSFAKKFVPSDIIVIQTDSWCTRTGIGQLEIEFVGVPVKIKCQLALKDVNGKGQESLDFEVKVNIPLISSKLEQVLADDLKLKFAKDTDVTMQLLPSFLAKSI